MRCEWLGDVKPMEPFGENKGCIHSRRPLRGAGKFSGELAVAMKDDPDIPGRRSERAYEAPPCGPRDSETVLGVCMAISHGFNLRAASAGC